MQSLYAVAITSCAYVINPCALMDCGNAVFVCCCHHIVRLCHQSLCFESAVVKFLHYGLNPLWSITASTISLNIHASMDMCMHSVDVVAITEQIVVAVADVGVVPIH
jgi:hypothetical protein